MKKAAKMLMVMVLLVSTCACGCGPQVKTAATPPAPPRAQYVKYAGADCVPAPKQKPGASAYVMAGVGMASSVLNFIGTIGMTGAKLVTGDFGGATMELVSGMDAQ